MRKFRGESFVITGGTGSFGQTMVSHLLATEAESVTVFSRDEAKQDLMRGFFRDERLKFVIGDVRDKDAVLRATRGATYLFHAAALKQVPSGEFFPMEVVKTNVLGSWNVMQAARESGVRRVVTLSTDKAVYPINAMGMSKALMEKNAFAMAREAESGGTEFVVTRYGNVMYSRGSVIPRFVDLLRNRRKLSITEPTMTRFLMSLDDSVALVEKAFTEVSNGDLLVRKSPAATLETLGQAVSRLFGVPFEFEVIGTRHGEKLFETLLGVEEMAVGEDLGDFYRVPTDTRDLNYAPYFELGREVSPELEAYTSHNTTRLSLDETETLLRSIPEIAEVAIP